MAKGPSCHTKTREHVSAPCEPVPEKLERNQEGENLQPPKIHRKAPTRRPDTEGTPRSGNIYSKGRSKGRIKNYKKDRSPDPGSGEEQREEGMAWGKTSSSDNSGEGEDSSE